MTKRREGNVGRSQEMGMDASARGLVSNQRGGIGLSLLLLALLFLCRISEFINFHNYNYDNIRQRGLLQHQHLLTDTGATSTSDDTISERQLSPKISDTAITETHSNISSSSQTKIVAMCDSIYKEIAPYWYHRLTRLGYDNVVVIAVDNETADYLEEKGIPYELLRHTAKSCPKFDGIMTGAKVGKQQYRRTIFGMRYLYLLHQLQHGYHILLSDIDNNFIQYMPMSVMELSGYDVYHAYGDSHPTEIFSQLGFTVCGGMAWFRSSPGSISFVKQILRKCGVRENSTEQCSICDDQRKINELLLQAYADSKLQLRNTTKWKIPTHTLDRNVFWKHSITGHWGLTGHTFKIWDVDTAYRGPMPTVDDQCPGKKQRNGSITTKNWVAMPENTNFRELSFLDNRKIRLREWFEQCERDKLNEPEGIVIKKKI